MNLISLSFVVIADKLKKGEVCDIATPRRPPLQAWQYDMPRRQQSSRFWNVDSYLKLYGPYDTQIRQLKLALRRARQWRNITGWTGFKTREEPERLQEWINFGYRDLSAWKMSVLKFIDIVVTPESSIQDDAADNYKYDFSKAAGEKRAREWADSSDEESSGKARLETRSWLGSED